MYSSKYLELLIEELCKLPSIGQKSAQRLALHLLRGSKEDALRLAEAIRAVKERVRLCGICGNFSDGLASWQDDSFDGAVSGLAIQYAESWCPERESNPYAPFRVAAGFKPAASTNSAIRACGVQIIAIALA